MAVWRCAAVLRVRRMAYRNRRGGDDLSFSYKDDEGAQQGSERSQGVSSGSQLGSEHSQEVTSGSVPAGTHSQQHTQHSPSAEQLPERLRGRISFSQQYSQVYEPATAAVGEDAGLPSELFQLKPLPITNEVVSLPASTPLICEWDADSSMQFPSTHPLLCGHIEQLLIAAAGCRTEAQHWQMAEHCCSVVQYSKRCVAQYKGPLWQQLQDQQKTAFSKGQRWYGKFCLFHGWNTHSTNVCRLRESLQQSGCTAVEFYEHMVMHPGHTWRKQQQQQQGFNEEQQAINSKGVSREQLSISKGERKRGWEQEQDLAAGAEKRGKTASARAAARETAAAAAESETVAGPMGAAALQRENEQLRAENKQLRRKLDYARSMLGKVVTDNAMMHAGVWE